MLKYFFKDNKVNQKVIAMFLNKEQVMYSIANNGLEAFQMVKEKPFGYYSLILLDLAMPIWDGYKVFNRSKKIYVICLINQIRRVKKSEF